MRVIDLFCGAGGFSEGFRKGGFEIVSAVDNWGDAVKTYRTNLKVKNVILKDIKKVRKSELNKEKEEVDVIVGGPPCQGFSLAGRRNRGDPRNGLFRYFVSMVSELEPKILVMENVKGILSMKTVRDEPVMEVIEDEFDEMGYKISHKILNAADYGVPQMRERVFIIANSLGIPNGKLFPMAQYGPDSKSCKPCNTVEKAIMDIADTLDPEDKWNHKPMKHCSRVVERLKRIPLGGDLAKDQRYLPKRLKRTGFAFNCKRLNLHMPSVTIVPGHYAFPIHPTLPRTLTVREIARIQTFDDKDIFCGSRLSQGIQVGNAVPPLLAKALADRFKRFL